MPELGRILEMLERDEALELELGVSGDSPGPGGFAWPEVASDESLEEVDHRRLFPPGRPTDQGNEDFDVYGDEWDLDEDDAESILEELGKIPITQRPPKWDVWAWYQPIHFFGPSWGIFIREVGLVKCARQLASSLPIASVTSRTSITLAKAVLRAAFSTLYLHEQYHHKTESAAIRMHVIERRSIYPMYHRKVYRKTVGTSHQTEEGLANADSWYRMTEPAHSKWTGATVTDAARQYLEYSFNSAPPGYSNATRLLSRSDFDAEQSLLFCQVQEGRVPSRIAPLEFGIATHLNHSLFNLSQRIWTIVPAAGKSLLPTHPAIAPLETRRLRRLVKKRGWAEVPGQGKGSHQKFRDADGRMIILPASKDVSGPVLKTTADTLGVNVRELEILARNI